jgi:SAM-dependent methyltransferase
MPIVHPLDYAWAFTPPTLARLAHRLEVATKPGQQIAHLGTPTLHEHAARVLADRDHILIDRDSRRVSAVAAKQDGGKAVVADLLEPSVPELSADVCVCDPPWYPEQAVCFVNAAALLTRPGGVLLLAFAGPLTRAGIDRDRATILAAAGVDGFSVQATEQRGCRYVTPPFEYAAMASAGLYGLPPDWRSGELITLRRDDRPTPARRTIAGDGWAAVEVDEIPLHVRSNAPPSGTALLSMLVDGDVLPTVSRRAPLREGAALWTSRNRIFGSSDPARLAATVRAVAAGDLSDLADDERDAAFAIITLIAIERDEHGLA